MNDHFLFIGWYDYAQAVRMLPLEAQLFQLWYFAMNPEKVADTSVVENALHMFGNDMQHASRSEAKRRLQVVVAHYRTDNEIMASPMTDPRPLILANT